MVDYELRKSYPEMLSHSTSVRLTVGSVYVDEECSGVGAGTEKVLSIGDLKVSRGALSVESMTSGGVVAGESVGGVVRSEDVSLVESTQHVFSGAPTYVDAESSGVVSVRRVDGTVQTRLVKSFDVDAESGMLGVRVEGLSVGDTGRVPMVEVLSSGGHGIDVDESALQMSDSWTQVDKLYGVCYADAYTESSVTDVKTGMVVQVDESGRYVSRAEMVTPTTGVELSAKETSSGAIDVSALVPKETVGVQVRIEDVAVVDSVQHVLSERVTDLTEAGGASMLLSKSVSRVEEASVVSVDKSVVGAEMIDAWSTAVSRDVTDSSLVVQSRGEVPCESVCVQTDMVDYELRKSHPEILSHSHLIDSSVSSSAVRSATRATVVESTCCVLSEGVFTPIVSDSTSCVDEGVLERLVSSASCSFGAYGRGGVDAFVSRERATHALGFTQDDGTSSAYIESKDAGTQTPAGGSPGGFVSEPLVSRLPAFPPLVSTYVRGSCGYLFGVPGVLADRAKVADVQTDLAVVSSYSDYVESRLVSSVSTSFGDYGLLGSPEFIGLRPIDMESAAPARDSAICKSERSAICVNASTFRCSELGTALVSKYVNKETEYIAEPYQADGAIKGRELETVYVEQEGSLLSEVPSRVRISSDGFTSEGGAVSMSECVLVEESAGHVYDLVRFEPKLVDASTACIKADGASVIESSYFEHGPCHICDLHKVFDSVDRPESLSYTALVESSSSFVTASLTEFSPISAPQISVESVVPIATVLDSFSSNTYLPVAEGLDVATGADDGITLEWSTLDNSLRSFERTFSESFTQTGVTTHDVSTSPTESLLTPFYQPSMSQAPTYRRSFACQFCVGSDMSDISCQANEYCPLIDSSSGLWCALGTDSGKASGVVVQNVSVTDIRERLVEHFYPPASSGAELVADVGIQVYIPSASSLSPHALPISPATRTLADVKRELHETYSYEAYMCNLEDGDVQERECMTDSSFMETGGDAQQTLQLSVNQTPYAVYVHKIESKELKEDAVATEPATGLACILSQFDVSEVWESLRTVTSDYHIYETRQDKGWVREQGTYVKEPSKPLADMGVQVEVSIPIESTVPESPAPTSSQASEADVFDNYLLRNRLGQLREVQCQAAPSLNGEHTQTDDLRFLSQPTYGRTSYEANETYQHRLLRDEVAEEWTQWDTDEELVTESDLEDLVHKRVEEEHYKEVRARRSRRSYSQVQITEEIADEPSLVVCELGVQTDAALLEKAFSNMYTSFTGQRQFGFSNTESVQTDPITLRSIFDCSDLNWIDQELNDTIMAGVTVIKNEQLETVETYQRTVEQRAPSYGEGRIESKPKIVATIGCQTAPVRTVVTKEELNRWTDVTATYAERKKTRGQTILDEEIFVRPMSISSTEESRPDTIPPMIVQLRQRTVQYELLESRAQLPNAEWNNIREVASPLTGLFAPVSMAIRRGWIRLGERNEYVDPTTGVAIPLATAFQMGRIRLAGSQGPTSRASQPSLPILLLIERVYFGWCKTQLVSVMDTARGEVLTPGAALQIGVIETSGNEIRFLDTMANNWISIEEGVGRQLIQVEAPDVSSETSSSEEEEPAVCRVFQLTHICPGGEPCTWITPLEATRLGLFKWDTGDVAADWPARPLIPQADTDQSFPEDAFIPTRWCSFLTARHGGWLRLSEEPESNRWIVTDGMPYQEPHAILLSKQINLVAPAPTAAVDFHSRSPRHVVSDFVHQRVRSDEFLSTTEESGMSDIVNQARRGGRSRSYAYALASVPGPLTSDTDYSTEAHYVTQVLNHSTQERYIISDNPNSSRSVSPLGPH